MSRELNAKRSNRYLGSVIASVLVLAVAACAGGGGSPESAIRKMIRAYGGPSKISRIQSYTGKGFIKELTQDIAMSNAFDVYVKGPLYKHKVYRAPAGKLSDVIVLCFDGRESSEWMKGRGVRKVPTMELGLSKYRFPAVLEWVRGADRAGEALSANKNDPEVRIRYRDGDVIVTLNLDRKSWLLGGVELRSSSDTSFSYAESYGHYRDVDGIPFPSTFKATYKGTPYFDYVLPALEVGAELSDSLFAVTGADTAAVTAPPKTEAQTPPQ